MYAKIEDGFWGDEKVLKLSPDGRYLLMYLLTSPHRNMVGLYVLPRLYAQADTELPVGRFEQAWKEVFDSGIASYDEGARVVLIHNFLRYNPLDGPNQVKGAVSRLASLPKTKLAKRVLEEYFYPQQDKLFLTPVAEALDRLDPTWVPGRVSETHATWVPETLPGGVPETHPAWVPETCNCSSNCSDNSDCISSGTCNDEITHEEIFDNAWRTSANARGAVAQRLIDGMSHLDLSQDSDGQLHGLIFEYLSCGIPPEVIRRIANTSVNLHGLSASLYEYTVNPEYKAAFEEAT